MKFLIKPFKSHGGVKVPHKKNTKDEKSIIMPPPKEVIIPMLQHIGAQCKPIVSVGEKVYVGQVIGDSEAFVSTPIHSSVSGVVKGIEKLRLPTSEAVDSILIESDGLMQKYSGIKPPKVRNAQELVEATRESGLVGLGGAGFPAHVKLKIPKGCKIDTLIVNAAECEPYITSDNRAILEEHNSLIDGINKIKNLLNIKKVIIAIESNKPIAIKLLEENLKNEDDIAVLKLKSRYPQGAEKILIKVCTNRVVPLGRLPSDVGCIVMNVGSVVFLSNYLKTGMPLVSKRVTIDGSAIKEPKNLIVPIGSRISDVIKFAGGYKSIPGKLIMGGPMMGIALMDDSLPVLKQNNAILAFDVEDAKIPKGGPCIRCGKCVEGCPMKLMPTLLEKQSKLKNVDELIDLNVMTCMECGCCSYNCPAGRNLVQSIKLGKLIVKNASKR